MEENENKDQQEEDPDRAMRPGFFCVFFRPRRSKKALTRIGAEAII